MPERFKGYVLRHFSTACSLIARASNHSWKAFNCKAVQNSARSEFANTGKAVLSSIVATTESPTKPFIRSGTEKKSD